MSTPDCPSSPPAPAHLPPLPVVIARAAVGGILMGLANLVPGISGGTMLVVAGVFTLFIGAIADLTALRITRRAVVTLAAVVIPAGLAILLLAGPVRDLVISHRWIMYSLFIGWTLGGVPALWAMARAKDAGPDAPPAFALPARVWAGMAGGFGLMLAMVLVQAGTSASASADASGPGLPAFFLGGLAAAAAMVLPGVSGGYLLLLLGLYVPILDAVDQLKQAVSARDIGAALDLWRVVIPVGLGIAAGVVGVSHLVKWLLERFERITIGVLLGLLLGAFLGLYPFQRPVPPVPGDILKGRVVTEAMLTAGEIKAKDWPTEYFVPSATQVGTSVILISTAAASTLLISRIGRRRNTARSHPQAPTAAPGAGPRPVSSTGASSPPSSPTPPAD